MPTARLAFAGVACCAVALWWGHGRVWPTWTRRRVTLAILGCVASLGTAVIVAASVGLVTCGFGGAKSVREVRDAAIGLAMSGFIGSVGPIKLALLRRHARWWPWVLMATVVLTPVAVTAVPDLSPSQHRAETFCQ